MGRVLSLMVAVLLAGCAGGAEPPGPAGSAAPEDRSKGVLAGVVVDDAIRPVAGASVRVTAPGVELNGTSDEQGRFRFANLDSGTYIVEVSKAFYSPHQKAVVVIAGVQDPELARFQLVFEPSSVPFASVYKYEGLHECGLSFVRVCSNINIATGIVLCGYHDSIPCFNVTSDSSLFFQRIEGIPTFLQGELVWEATTDTGRALNFYIGGGNRSELQSGFASTYNATGGESPLMLRLTNHEGDSAWCRRPSAPEPCPDDALNWSRIGTERALLGQVDAGPTQDLGTCGTPIRPCQVGLSVQQKFTMFTTVFYGYEPPDDWRFAVHGNPPPPPA